MNNFDLKQFLTENKLTSNSRILNEAKNREVEFDGQPGTFLMNVGDVQVYSLDDSSAFDTMFYGLVTADGREGISIEVGGEPVDKEHLQSVYNLEPDLAAALANDINNELDGRILKEERVTVINDNFPYIEFTDSGKKYSVEFEYYDQMDDHGYQLDVLYVGEDQFGDKWSIEVTEDRMSGDVDEYDLSSIQRE